MLFVACFTWLVGVNQRALVVCPGFHHGIVSQQRQGSCRISGGRTQKTLPYPPTKVLIVAIAPIFIITLITSVALTDILLASSERTIVSPITTSCFATVADLSKPCCIEVGLASLPLLRPLPPRWLRPPRDCSSFAGFFFLRRAPPSSLRSAASSASRA